MTRRSASVIKVGVVDVDVRISSHLKEELTWAIDKRLWVISTIICYLKNSKSTKELNKLKNKAVLNLKQYCMRCYVALSYVF